MNQTKPTATPSGSETVRSARFGLLDAAAAGNIARWPWSIVFWLACLALLAHAVLIAGGRWDGDEFFNFTHYRQSGIAYLLFRMLHWSPRPASEFVLYLYSLAVVRWNAPLITPFLSVLWGTLIVSAVAAAWFGSREGRQRRVGIALTLTAMFLLGHQINEMFFWPMAAAPYLLALAAIVVATFAIIGGHTSQPGGRFVAALALSIAVLSAETGLFMASAFAAVLWLAERRRARDGVLGGVRDGVRGGVRGATGAIWYLTPLVLSFAVLIFEFSFRVGDATSGVGPTEVYFHHPWPSLVAALQTLPHELVLHDRSGSLGDTASWCIEALLLAGFYCAAGIGIFGAAPWRHLVALAIALPCTIGLTIFASFYQYSAWGFERHYTFCQCLVVLLLLVVARLVAQLWPMPQRLAPIGAFGLIAAMGIALSVRLPAIVHDDGLLPEIRTARDMTWDSGEAAATDTMQYTLPPAGEVLTASLWQAGHFSIDPPRADTPWYVPGVLAFFGKKSVTIVPFLAAAQN